MGGGGAERERSESIYDEKGKQQNVLLFKNKEREQVRMGGRDAGILDLGADGLIISSSQEHTHGCKINHSEGTWADFSWGWKTA